MQSLMDTTRHAADGPLAPAVARVVGELFRRMFLTVSPSLLLSSASYFDDLQLARSSFLRSFRRRAL